MQPWLAQLLLLVAINVAAAPQPGQQPVPRVELLGWGVAGWRDQPPRSGVPLGGSLLNWRAKAEAMHSLVWSDAGLRTGVRREEVVLQGRFFNGSGFAVVDYVGDARYGKGPGSAMTVLGTVLTAGLLDLPLPDPTLVQSLRAYLAPNGVAMNNPPGMAIPSVGTFWYTLVNQVFFHGLSAVVPALDPDFSQLRLAADSWAIAAVAMARNGTFDHTGFDFATSTPIDNHLWKEPDNAGGIAFVTLLAYAHTKDPTHLAAARLALDFLEGTTASPLYEMMLPFGAAAAARYNALNGSKVYDTAKLSESLGFAVLPPTAVTASCIQLLRLFERH